MTSNSRRVCHCLSDNECDENDQCTAGYQPDNCVAPPCKISSMVIVLYHQIITSATLSIFLINIDLNNRLLIN